MEEYKSTNMNDITEEDILKEEFKMATATMGNNSSNVFEFEVSKNKLADILKKLEKTSLTKEYLDECKRTASLFKKPSK